ncbi:MAG: amidohydrolase family protein [Rhodothermales bacterium]|nr:amidohydrolase family protein [Rhodothermales bacterium]
MPVRRWKAPALALLACLLLAAPLRADAQTVLIRAGHLIDPAGERVLTDQQILVRDGEIIEVGREVQAEGVEEEVDLTGAWVMPGLIDAHVHLTANLEYRRADLHRMYVNESDALRALRGARNAELLLRGGFTTVKEIGNDGDYATADVIEAIRRGWVRGPTIVYAGKIIAPTGGQIGGVSPRNEGFWRYEYHDADTHDEIRKAIRRNIYHGATAIKLFAGDHPEPVDYYYTEDDIAFAVEEARRSNLSVTVHTSGGPAARNVIRGGAAAIEHGFDLDDALLREMADRGTFLVGTDFHFDNWYAYGMDSTAAQGMYRRVVDRLRRAHALGVPLAFGSDIIIDLPGMNRVESGLRILETWKDAGIPPMDALRALTDRAAALMHLESQRGRVAPGHRADLVALPKNPLDDLGHLREIYWVMKDGVVARDDVP